MGDPSKKDNIFAFPGQQEASCGLLQSAGQTGLVPLNQCSMLAPILATTTYGDCGCMACDGGGDDSEAVDPTSGAVDPTPAPVPIPTPNPTLSAPVEPVFPPAMEQSKSGA